MAATQTEQKPSLISGRKMMCPKCRKERDILDFQRMEDIPEFAHETAPIYKCDRRKGGCGWFFAPSEHAVLDSLNPNGRPEEIKVE